MFRFSLTEKHLLFIPTLLLASQIYYRIMFLQAAEAPEVVAFNIVPTALASLAIGIFFRRAETSKQSRFLLHTLITSLLIVCTLIQPSHFYGAELIVVCILIGMVFASIPDSGKHIIAILPAFVLAGLLFAPSQQLIRYFNFILLPFAQFCLLCAYFIIHIPRKSKVFSGLPLVFLFLILSGVTFFLLTNRNPGTDRNYFQRSLQGPAIQDENYPLSLLALVGQEKYTRTEPQRVSVIENGNMLISQYLEVLKKHGLNIQIEHIQPDFIQNSQRLLPFLKPDFPTPAEIHEAIENTDLVIVVPPMPTERSSAFLTSAAFFTQIFDKLPRGGILAVYANGTPEQNLTIYNSLPSPGKDKEGNGGEILCFALGKTASLYVCRKQKDLLLDSRKLKENLPANIAPDILELVFPTLLRQNMNPPDKNCANRPFHPELLWLKNPPAQQPFFHFLVDWHAYIVVALLGIYLLLRYFISWKPIHKPCFQAFENGLLIILLLAGTVIFASAMGCGPIFALIPTITAVFAATFWCSSLFSSDQHWEKYDCIPLLLVILFFLLGWNLPAASAMIAALAMKAFLKRQTPELPPEQLIFPKIWMIIGMSVALTAASFFLILPIK